MFEFTQDDFQFELPKKKNNYIIHNLDQNSQEWHEIRLGKITASNISVLDSNGKTRQDFIYKKASEILTGLKSESFNNFHIQRGLELEDEAKEVYEKVYNEKITNVGFVELNAFVGCSPDGFVGDDGMIQIKCLCDHVYFDYIINQKISKTYLYQIQMEMYVCDKKYNEFVIYNPNFDDSIFRIKIDRDEEIINKIKTNIDKTIKDIKTVLKQFKQNVR